MYDATTTIYQIYSENIAPLTPMLTERLKLDEDEYGTQAVKDAIKEAVFRNVRKLSYIEAILKNRSQKDARRKAHELAGG